MLSYPKSQAMSSASLSTGPPRRPFSSLSPRVVVHPDACPATIIPLMPRAQRPLYRILAHVRGRIHHEIANSQTLPLTNPVFDRDVNGPRSPFLWAVMIRGRCESTEALERMEQEDVDWTDRFLGAFYIKAKYSGASSHVCTGGFWVPVGHRRRGLGKLMGMSFLDWAPRLVRTPIAVRDPGAGGDRRRR